MRSIAYVLMVLSLAACASVMHQFDSVPLDDHSQYSLQPIPHSLQGTARLERLLIRTPTDEKELLLQIEIHSQHINMVGLTSAGIVIFEMRWQHGSNVELSLNVPFNQLSPITLLAYFQLANWPQEAIELGLVGLTITDNGSTTARDFQRNDKSVFSIKSDMNNKIFIHKKQNFSILIEPLRAWEIDG